MTNILVEWMPLLTFFIGYKIGGIYTATAVLMIATFLQIILTKFYFKKELEKMHWATFILVTIMGSLTLLFHNENFIKWKPTILYLLCSAAFFMTPIIKQNNLIEIMLASKIKIEKNALKVANNCFVLFFLAMSGINTYVFMKYSTETWVNFKLFGTLIITLLFMLGISSYILRNKID